MSPSALFPRDHERHAAMTAWCDQVGIDPRVIPAEPCALVVTPLNEGQLEAVFVEYETDDGHRIIDHTACAPGCHHCGGYLRREQPSRLVVTDPPPGFHLPSWDAYAYVQFGPIVNQETA